MKIEIVVELSFRGWRVRLNYYKMKLKGLTIEQAVSEFRKRVQDK